MILNWSRFQNRLCVITILMTEKRRPSRSMHGDVSVVRSLLISHVWHAGCEQRFGLGDVHKQVARSAHAATARPADVTRVSHELLPGSCNNVVQTGVGAG